MISQFRAICRIKELREDKLQRAVERKRREIRTAEQEKAAAERRARDNEQRMIKREKAIYARLLGKISTPARFERAKSKVRMLEAEQQHLVDLARQAAHAVQRLEGELECLRDEHRQATIDRDKYHTTTRRLELEARIAAEAAEEVDLEEISISNFAGAR